jgi:hypothetical protein
LIFRRECPKVVCFTGRRISHEWVVDDETDERKWYNGTVTEVVSGRDGYPNAVYNIQYDGEDGECEVDHLIQDYQSSSVRFIDL